MPLRVYCPTGHVLMVPDERAGRAVRCPKCQQIVEVPAASNKPNSDPLGATSPPPPPVKPPAVATPATTTTVPSPIQFPATPGATKPTPPVTAKTASEPAAAPLSPNPPQASAPPTKTVANPPSATATRAITKPAGIPANGTAKANSAVSTPVPVPPPAPPQPPPPPPPPGIVAPHEQVVGAYTLAGITCGVAAFSIAPAIWEIGDSLAYADGNGIARWAFLLLMLGVVQVGYALYVAQLPDWTTAWTASLFSLILAGAYGMLLGISVMSKEDSWLIKALELTDKLVENKAAFWAIAMISLMSLLAWYAGHLSAGWHRKEIVLRQAGLSAGR